MGNGSRGLLGSITLALRNWRSRQMFGVLKTHCRGEVLDVGGWDFVNSAKNRNIAFDSWTILEPNDVRFPEIPDDRVSFVLGDGCEMQFPNSSFDTVLCIQVLEHVFEPIRMVEEISRVLRSGGKAIFLIPQTSTTHMAPEFYQNMSRYWVERAMERGGLKIISHKPLGGFWSTQASHMLYFFFHSARIGGFSDRKNRRNLLFYFLWPFMAVLAILLIPIGLLFSFGDLSEEPNNHLVLVGKE
jgi:SAM-dependent methyltransferase